MQSPVSQGLLVNRCRIRLSDRRASRSSRSPGSFNAKMSTKVKSDISLNVTSFYMKIVGVWLAENSAEKRRRKFTMACTVNALIIATTVEAAEVYHSWGDFGTTIYIMCNIASVTIGLFKVTVSVVHKKELHNLLLYARANFWHTNYDPHEQIIVDTCRRTCTFLICVFNFFAQGTVAFYVAKPILANIGRNESDRVLPFQLWLDLPLTISPYYEIVFTIQVFSLYYCGVCYLCFDNVLCILNLHTASQFRILQYRLVNINTMDDLGKSAEISKQTKQDSSRSYEMLVKCVQQHQALVRYCEKLEEVFTLITLGQVVLFSLLICLDGYLVLMENAPGTQQLTFGFHVTGCMVQLLMFTYSCDSLIRESGQVAKAAYECLWSVLPMDESGRMIRKNLILVMMRSQQPCCLTASGFFVVSLETYTAVLSTAVSYFTLLTQY